MDPNQEEQATETEFARAARQQKSNLMSDFWGFAMQNKKWWLIPIVVILLLFGALLLIGSSSVGSMIYPLF